MAITKDNLISVQKELAKAAGITEVQAEAVLKALHIDKMVEQSQALETILSDTIKVQALGFSNSHASEMKQVLSTPLSLSNLRVALKPPGITSTIIV